MKANVKNSINTLKNSGIYLLLLFAVLLLFSSSLFLIHIEISSYHLLFSIIIATILFLCIDLKKQSLLSMIVSIGIALSVFVVATFISQNYIDLSWDGNSYHKDAVGLLKNKWNPVYEDYINAYKRIGNRNMDYIGEKIQTTHGFWQANYPKGTWIIGANIYAVTGNIESGKVYNLLIIYITFVLTLFILYQANSNFVFAFIISLIICINPVILAQAFTYYNDGFMGNLLFLLIFMMFLFSGDKKILSKSDLYLSICSILLLISNTKFTGFAYAGIFCFFFYLLFLYRLHRKKEIKKAIQPTILFAITVFIGIFIIGFSPYVKNIIDHKQIFYPLQGENKVDIVTHNQPKQFQNKSTFYKCAKSLLSKASNVKINNNLKLEKKFPFTIYKSELEQLSAVDLRISGFGVLFSGILLLSVFFCTIYLIKLAKEKKKNFVLFSIPLVITTLLMFFISESWWARYTPYLYLFPIIALILINFYGGKFKHFCFYLLAFLVFVNIGLYFRYNTVSNYKKASQIMNNINSIDKTKKVIIVDHTNEFLGSMYNFEDNNINFKVSIKSLKGDRPLYKWIKYRYEEEEK